MLTKPAVDPALTLGLEVAMLRAPRLVPTATWCLQRSEDGLEMHDSALVAPHDQPTWVSYGMAAEFLVFALHETGLSATVRLDDSGESAAVARFDVLTSAAPSWLDAALFEAGTSRQWQTLLLLPDGAGQATAYQQDILLMAAESQGAELMWHATIAPGHERQAIVTKQDDASEWFRAGRAAAHVLLRAETLGLQAKLVTPSLRRAQLRATVRSELRPPRYPQVLLQISDD